MSKFKAGDRVYYIGHDKKLGGAGTVNKVRVSGTWPISVTFDNGEEAPYLDEWEIEPLLTESDCVEGEHTGGSSSYYDVLIPCLDKDGNKPKDGDGNLIDLLVKVRCLDIIKALDMRYAEANALKAAWRIAAAKQGKTKKGNNMYYDAEKIKFFGEDLMKEFDNEKS